MLRRIAVVAAVLVGGCLMLLGCAERSILYPARFRETPDAVALPDFAREVSVEHGQGRTYGHLYLGKGVSAETPGPLVIYSHGNGELIEDYPMGFSGYRRLGVSVLLTEYRGVGRSDGKPSKKRIDADHVAFFDLAAALPEVDADRIVLHGRSMGGGIVASLVRSRKPAALVLESTYSSIKDCAWRLWVPGFMVKDDYDVAAALRVYDGPVFMSHSKRDEVIPYAMSEVNRAARPESLPGIVFVSYDLGHNDPTPSAFYEAVADFLREAEVLDALR